MLQTPSLSAIDGINLRQYHAGFEYVVGTTIGSLLLLHGWAELVGDSTPAVVEPVDERRSAKTRMNPSNQRREYSGPPGADRAHTAATRRRGRRSTRKRSR